MKAFVYVIAGWRGINFVILAEIVIARTKDQARLLALEEWDRNYHGVPPSKVGVDRIKPAVLKQLKRVT